MAIKKLKVKVKKTLPKAKPGKKLLKKSTKTVAPKVQVPVVKKAKATKTAKVVYGGAEGLFMLTLKHLGLAESIAKNILKVKDVFEQVPHKDYVAWAVPGKSGKGKRIGGLWVHNNHLCLQIRWMTQDVLDKAKELGFTVYGTVEHDIKCNRLHVGEGDLKKAITLMTMQAKAIQEGLAPSGNLNS